MNHSSAHGYTDNEIIAQWMGLKRHEPNADYCKAQYYRPDPKDARKKGDFVCYYDGLEYDTSWGVLMPVVEKINSLDGVSYIIEGNCAMEISRNGARIAFYTSDSMINTVYKAVVEFIKYWNNEKTNDKV